MADLLACCNLPVLFLRGVSIIIAIEMRSLTFVLHNVTASRAKMQAISAVSRMRGTSKVNMYPQPEGTLGETMLKHGRDLGDDNMFGKFGRVQFCIH